MRVDSLFMPTSYLISDLDFPIGTRRPSTAIFQHSTPQGEMWLSNSILHVQSTNPNSYVQSDG